MNHVLKSWPEHFQSAKSGIKNFEIRLNDRNFHVGDTLTLQEWDPETKEYTGDECVRKLKYMSTFNQMPGHVVLGLETVNTEMADLAMTNRNLAEEVLVQLGSAQAREGILRDTLSVAYEYMNDEFDDEKYKQVIDLIKKSLAMPFDTTALQIVLLNQGDVIEGVRQFNLLAGNTDNRYNVEQFAMYTGLQLEELAEKMDHMGIKWLAETLDNEGKKFKTGHYNNLVAMAASEDMLDDDVDLGVVTIGALLSQGADIHGAFAEVQRANMAKVFPDGTLHKNEHQKIIKPDDWTPPDLSRFIAKPVKAEPAPTEVFGRAPFADTDGAPENDPQYSHTPEPGNDENS